MITSRTRTSRFVLAATALALGAASVATSLGAQAATSSSYCGSSATKTVQAPSTSQRFELRHYTCEHFENGAITTRSYFAVTPKQSSFYGQPTARVATINVSVYRDGTLYYSKNCDITSAMNRALTSSSTSRFYCTGPSGSTVAGDHYRLRATMTLDWKNDGKGAVAGPTAVTGYHVA